MGKCLASLLVLISLLIAPSAFPDEQTRRIQVELRKRHLFFNNIDGERNPTLTKALQLYQQRQGLPPSGLIDADTLASLGIVAHLPIDVDAPRPTVANGSEVRGPNGERLPEQQLLAITDSDEIDLRTLETIPVAYEVPFQSAFTVAAPPAANIPDPNGTGTSYPIDLNLGPGTTQLPVNWSTLVLGRYSAGADFMNANLERARPPAESTRRRPHPAKAQPRRHEEKNPIVLAFHTVNRMIRNVLADKPANRSDLAAHHARRSR